MSEKCVWRRMCVVQPLSGAACGRKFHRLCWFLHMSLERMTDTLAYISGLLEAILYRTTQSRLFPLNLIFSSQAPTWAVTDNKEWKSSIANEHFSFLFLFLPFMSLWLPSKLLFCHVFCLLLFPKQRKPKRVEDLKNEDNFPPDVQNSILLIYYGCQH